MATNITPKTLFTNLTPNAKTVTQNANEVKKRKEQMSEYQELFQALFKLRDKSVVARVMNAINNVASKVSSECENCAKMKSISRVSCYTQTLKKDFNLLLDINEMPSTSADCKPNKHKRIKRTHDKRKNEPFAVFSDAPANNVSINDDDSKTIKKRIPSDTMVDMLDLGIPLPELPGENDILKMDKLMDPDTLRIKMQIEWTTAFKANKFNLLPIHIAAQTGDINLMKRQYFVLKFLQKDIHFNAKNEDGNTPLHYAIVSDKNEETLTFLLSKHLRGTKEPILRLNNNGDNVLHFAAKNTDNHEVFKKILANVTNLNMLRNKNYDGYSVLHLIVQRQKYLYAKILMEYIDKTLGIEPLDENDCKPIDYYIKIIKQHIHGEATLLSSKKLEIVNQIESKTNRTALFEAILSRNNVMILMLLAHCSNPRLRDNTGMTCLTLANDSELDKIVTNAITVTDNFISKKRRK